jgi:hypothetical protein
MRSFLALLLAALLMGGFAATASAQSPTQDAYGGVLGEQVEDEGTPAAPKSDDEGTSGPQSGAEGQTVLASTNVQTSSGDSLPFTGLDLAVVVLIGVSLVGLGFGLRWASRRTPA